MVRLTLFGGLTLSGEDGTTGVIASRKCRALLAYLSLQLRPVPRERLATLRRELPDGGTRRVGRRQPLA